MINSELDFLDSNNLILPYNPINSITSIKYKEKPTDSLTTISSTDYAINGRYIYSESGFTKTYIYEVIANFGYSTIPDDLVSIATEMVAIKFRESKNGDDSLGKGTMSDSKSGCAANTSFIDMNTKFKPILDKYRKYVI